MLVEIQSDVFKCENIKEGKITFHEGLNTIIGYNNSVGKSLLLFAIDFAFGGDDYPTIDNAMIKNVGHHSVKFTHSFNGIYHTYLRSTNDPSTVVELKSGTTMKKWNINEFRKFLFYNLKDNELSLSFRELVGPFSRINNKKTNDVSQPMYYYAGQKPSNQVESFLKHIIYMKNILKKKI